MPRTAQGTAQLQSPHPRHPLWSPRAGLGVQPGPPGPSGSACPRTSAQQGSGLPFPPKAQPWPPLPSAPSTDSCCCLASASRPPSPPPAGPQETPSPTLGGHTREGHTRDELWDPGEGWVSQCSWRARCPHGAAGAAGMLGTGGHRWRSWEAAPRLGGVGAEEGSWGAGVHRGYGDQPARGQGPGGSADETCWPLGRRGGLQGH